MEAGGLAWVQDQLGLHSKTVPRLRGKKESGREDDVNVPRDYCFLLLNTRAVDGGQLAVYLPSIQEGPEFESPAPQKETKAKFVV